MINPGRARPKSSMQRTVATSQRRLRAAEGELAMTTQQTGRLRYRGVLHRTVMVLCAAALLAPIALAVLAPTFADARAKFPESTFKSAEVDVEPIEPTDGLGVRELPLLSADALRALHEPGTADDLGNSVFGILWPTAIAASADFVESSAYMQDYPYTYGALEPLAAGAVAQASSTSIVDLAGVLLFRGDDAGAVIALSVLEQLVEIDSGCDSSLALAHASSLRWGMPPDALDALWGVAIARCPDDPTARFAATVSRLARSFASSCGPGPLPDVDARAPIIEAFQSLQRDFPTVAAGFVGEGETRLSQALESQGRGMRPFWVRAQLSAAEGAFERAAGLTQSAEIARALARVHLAQDSAQSALDDIEGALGDDAPATTLHTAERAYALIGDFEAADRLAERAAGQTGVQQPTSLVATTGPLFPSAITDVAGFGESAERELLVWGGGCGSSLVTDQSFVPAFHQLVDPPRLDRAELYALLAHPLDGLGDLDTEGYDDRINVLREWKLLNDAQAVALEWTAAFPNDGLAQDRLGEVRYLLRDYAGAAEAFQAAVDVFAADLAPAPDWYGERSTGPAWASLRLGASLAELGETGASREALEDALGTPAVDEYGSDDPRVRFYALLTLGRLAYASGEHQAALRYLDDATKVGEEWEADHVGEYLLRGTEAQTASAAALQLGDAGAALDWAEQAVRRDPGSPLFVETVAEAARAASQPADAITAYRAALALDGSLFSTWNNLGVLLLQDGERVEAEEAFRRALALRTDYPTAWHNLGVVWSAEGGIADAIAAQGAFATAGRSDSDFRHMPTDAQFDEVIYDSGVDVSRRVAEDWQLSETASVGQSRITWGVFAVVAWRIAWALGLDAFVSRAVAGVLRRRPMAESRLHRLGRARPPWFWMAGVSAGAAVLLSGSVRPIEWVVVSVGVVALLGLHLLVAGGALTDGWPARATWVPAVGLTTILAVFGLGFAPPPVVRDDSHVATKPIRLASLALGVATALYVVTALVTAAPATSAIAASGLVVISSALMPIRPLDGAWLSLRRGGELASSAALAGGAVIFALGWV